MPETKDTPIEAGKATHTPAPWRVAPASDYLDASVLHVDAKQRGYICSVGKRDDLVAQADARLIAKAPDLLALVYQYRDDMRHGVSEDSAMRRAQAIEVVLAVVEGR